MDYFNPANGSVVDQQPAPPPPPAPTLSSSSFSSAGSPLPEDDSSSPPLANSSNAPRPRNRPRGVSLPSLKTSGGGLLAYLPTPESALSSLHALDLDLPTLPAHLTYSSLRQSLLAHISDLERRVVQAYGSRTSVFWDDPPPPGLPSMGGEPSFVGEGEDDDDHHDHEEVDVSLSDGEDTSTTTATPNAANGNLRNRKKQQQQQRLRPTTASKPRRHERSVSGSRFVTPEQLLAHLAQLRSDVLASLPHVPSPSTSSLRSLVTPFLSTLPARLEKVHGLLPSLPSASSSLPSSYLPDLSLDPSTSLGAGATQVFALLDALLPKEDGYRSCDEEEEGMFLPAFPNRTRSYHRSRATSFISVRTAESTAGSVAGDGIGLDDDIEVKIEIEEDEERSVEIAVRKARERLNGLIEFEDLPFMWRNNEFVHSGYRFIPVEEWPRLVRSLFQLHNETVNIHSHLVSSLVVLLAIPLALYSSPFLLITGKGAANPPHVMDTIVMASFMLAAFKCLFCSSLWHLFAGCATKRYFLAFACVDYVGISWLIAASVNTVVYFGFYCHPTPMTLYGLLNLSVGIAGSTLPFMRFFNERRNKKFRILFFVSMAFSALGPIAHMALQNGLWRTLAFIKPMRGMIGSYLFGLWFYGHHFPESRWPGWFDRFGASHNIWHFSIVTAILFHYLGVLELYRMKDTYSCAALP